MSSTTVSGKQKHATFTSEEIQ